MVYQDIVQKHKYVFQNADCMSDKTVIATNIVKLVQEQSGRFLMKNTTITPDGNSSDSWWIALKDSVAIDKFFQSLTYAATKLYQLQQRQEAAMKAVAVRARSFQLQNQFLLQNDYIRLSWMMPPSWSFTGLETSTAANPQFALDQQWLPVSRHEERKPLSSVSQHEERKPLSNMLSKPLSNVSQHKEHKLLSNVSLHEECKPVSNMLLSLTTLQWPTKRIWHCFHKRTLFRRRIPRGMSLLHRRRVLFRSRIFVPHRRISIPFRVFRPTPLQALLLIPRKNDPSDNQPSTSAIPWHSAWDTSINIANPKVHFLSKVDDLVQKRKKQRRPKLKTWSSNIIGGMEIWANFISPKGKNNGKDHDAYTCKPGDYFSRLMFVVRGICVQLSRLKSLSIFISMIVL